MNNKLIDELTQLEIKFKYLKRQLDMTNNKEKRTEIFNSVKKTQKEIEKVKFKIRLEREIRK